MTSLPGVSGSLFPGRFLAAITCEDGSERTTPDDLEHRRRQFVSWWQQVERQCGPATGLRALFDLVAMPLAGLLGFRARNAVFDPGRVTVEVHTAEKRLQLVLVPWATRPSSLWRDLGTIEPGAAPWCLLVAPPFVSIVDLRGRATRRSVDFTLPAAIDDRSFPAFWTVCHAAAALDTLVEDAGRFRDAVREDLQAGVVRALAAIGPVLDGSRSQHRPSAFAEALTIVYRVLFLLFAESRDLLPRRHPAFARAYAVTSLCRGALQAPAGATGLWDGLAAVTRLSRVGCDTTDLIVKPFNGQLFSREAAPELETIRRSVRSTRSTRRRDEALARALVALATRPGRGGREEISYSDLGVEQLGAVYERILDLDPDAILELDRSEPESPRGHDARTHSQRRKDSGTFYTPQPLAEFVVRRTLAPLVRGLPADDILTLRVLDPAMGSGAFLVAACRYLSHAYGCALVDEGRCAETDLDADMRSAIRRTVAARCLAGVDVNPVAVQLARLSLWLTTLAKDRPLSFLDHQLRVGDSLVGASPDDLWREPRRQRTADPSVQSSLFESVEFDAAMRDVVQPLCTLRDGHDDTVADVRERGRLWSAISGHRSPLARWRQACDLWCARWFWPGGRPPSAQEIRSAVGAIVRDDRTLGPATVDKWLDISGNVARQRQFFHWPLEFADAFYDVSGAPRTRPGFDAVLGNPPWDLLRRDRSDFLGFVRESGVFTACGRGRLNLYQPFVERAQRLTRPGGRVGLVLPWGLASDDGAAMLRRALIDRSSLDTIVGLHNAEGIFPIHRGLRFLVLGARIGGQTSEIHARFGVRSLAGIEALPSDDSSESDSPPVRLNLESLRRVGGPLLRIPDVRREADLSRVIRLARVLPALGSNAGWAARFGRELNATEDRRSFGVEGLPVIDGKHIGCFRTSIPPAVRRIWGETASRALPDRRYLRARLAYRDVSGVGNRRAFIAAVVPANVVTTHTLFCLKNELPLEQQHFLCGLFNSRELDTIVRMLMGSHVTTSLVEQLPVPPWIGDAEQVEISRTAVVLADDHLRPGSREFDALARHLDALVRGLYDRAIR